METKVIQIPNSKIQSFQKRMSDRFHERKASVAVSMASILVLSLFMNQWLISPAPVAGVDAQARGIASVANNPEDYVKAVKWEHEMADDIARNKSSGAHLAVKPTLRDDLLFGSLAGRYGVELEQGRILSLKWTESQSNGEPVGIENVEGFLAKYKDIWTVKFSSARLEEVAGEHETYQLISYEGKTVAKAQLDFDQARRLLTIKIVK